MRWRWRLDFAFESWPPAAASRWVALAAESERLLRSIYEAIGSGVLVYDNEGRITNANAAAAEILGRPGEELLGITWSDLQAWLSEDGWIDVPRNA